MSYIVWGTKGERLGKVYAPNIQTASARAEITYRDKYSHVEEE